jgi:hypothetical protein
VKCVKWTYAALTLNSNPDDYKHVYEITTTRLSNCQLISAGDTDGIEKILPSFFSSKHWRPINRNGDPTPRGGAKKSLEMF